MKSPGYRSPNSKPSKIVTTMHIYSTNNIKLGNINPEPSLSKSIQARRSKQGGNTGELFIQGENIQKVIARNVTPDKGVEEGTKSVSDLRVQTGGNKRDSRNREGRVSGKVGGKNKDAVSAASFLFEEEKEKKSNKPQPQNAPMEQSNNPELNKVLGKALVDTFGKQDFLRLQPDSRSKTSKYIPALLQCQFCNSGQCKCSHIGGSYKNCPHCKREEYSTNKVHTVPNIESVQYLQDKIMQMLQNDFKQF